MKVRDIAELIEGELICVGDNCDQDIKIGCSSDLMSDILTLDVEDGILITGLANEQAIRTAEMADLHHIILVRNKNVSPNMLDLAKEAGISIIRTRHTMFTTCGRLMNAGLESPY